MFEEGKYDLMLAQAFGGGKGYPIVSRQNVVPLPAGVLWLTPAWAAWLFSDGTKGVEPPDDIKRMAEIPVGFYAEGDPAKRDALEQEIFQILVGNLYVVGGMDEDGSLNFAVYSKKLRNQVGKIWARYHHEASAWFLTE